MTNIIPLHGDRHQETRDLLPWYVNGTLDEVDRATVDAHLAGCADCRAELAAERRLKAEIAALPVETGEGWSALRRRIEAQKTGTYRPAPRSARPERPTFRRPGRLGWVVAAQAAALVLVTSFALQQRAPVAPYHTLGSAPAPAAGNVIVIFRPGTSEAHLRDALVAVDARLVDGPTDAGAYVLHVPEAARDAALAKLQAMSDVSMAQPIDPAPAP